jgi:hypothetical protein
LGRIDAPTGEIEGVGAGVAAVGPSLSAIAGMVRGADRGMAEPPMTAAALADLGGRWSRAADMLGEEIAALGRAAEASAVAYAVTDRSAMGGGP